MKTILLTLALFTCLASEAAAASPLESIEWCDIWISHANETNLPRVLLIGDSITRDYYPGVEKRLAGRAYVARLATSRFIGDPVLLKELALVLNEMKFDVIHFNNGMHGWQHSDQEYARAFPKFLAAIRAHAPDQKLIWASTTPLKVSPPGNTNPTQATDERIAARNASALARVQRYGIEVDDLNALIRGHPEYHRDNVHFNEQGIDLEAEQVGRLIARKLSAH